MGPAILSCVMLLAPSSAPVDGGTPDGGVDERIALTPIIAPAYTPELGFIGSVGGVLGWSGSPGHPRVPRSALTLVASLTTVGGFLSQLRLNTFLLEDRLRVSALVDVRDQPDHYFGVGVATALARELSADTTGYRRRAWTADPRVLVQVAGPLYVGAVVELRGTLSRDVSPGVAADPVYASRGADHTTSTGLGITLVHDSRDVPLNAYRGLYVAAEWLVYAPILFGTSRWQSASLDYRHYVTLGREGSTLTWQLRYRTAWGDVPWPDLSTVGTPFDLRAYRLGRFRDATALTALVEYRFMLPFEPGWARLWTRLGFAAWIGAGVLGSSLLPDFTQPLPAAGVGLRILVQDRVTLRLDLGVGRGSTAFYFQFLEAF